MGKGLHLWRKFATAATIVTDLAIESSYRLFTALASNIVEILVLYGMIIFLWAMNRFGLYTIEYVCIGVYEFMEGLQAGINIITSALSSASSGVSDGISDVSGWFGGGSVSIGSIPSINIMQYMGFLQYGKNLKDTCDAEDTYRTMITVFVGGVTNEWICYYIRYWYPSDIGKALYFVFQLIVPDVNPETNVNACSPGKTTTVCAFFNSYKAVQILLWLKIASIVWRVISPEFWMLVKYIRKGSFAAIEGFRDVVQHTNLHRPYIPPDRILARHVTHSHSIFT